MIHKGYERERQSAASLSALMDQTQDAMVCFTFREPVHSEDPPSVINAKLNDAIVTEASDKLARYFGFNQRKDILGKHLLELFNGELPGWFYDYGNDVKTGGFENVEREIEIPVNSKQRTMRIHIQNILHDNMLVSQWVTIRDVHREVQQRQAIEANTQLKALAMETVGLRTFSLSLDPNDKSKPFGHMSVDEHDVDDWFDSVHPDDRANLQQAFVDYYHGKTQQIHTTFRRASETDAEIWMENWAVASARDDKGKPREIIGVVMDRTESKALEEKLIAGQRLERLGVLAGGIAHDFNNLLMTVAGATEVTLLRHPELKDELEIIEQTTSTAAQLCDQLLTYAGRGSVDLAPLDFSQLLNCSKDLLKINAGPDARLHFAIEDDCTIRGESSQLIQIVMNLVTNASEALQGQCGNISVGLQTIEYAPEWQVTHHLGSNLEPGQRYAVLSIADDGCGIPPSTQERLFDPFYTTKVTGRGLGLAVVMGAVNTHGGAINVKSRLDHGTTVSVALPLLNEYIAQTDEKDTSTTTHLNGCVLVVDDETRVRETLATLLQAIGITSEPCSGGHEALQLIEQNPDRYHAVLLDVTMPEMDGIEAASHILERFPTIRPILCSGYPSIAVPPKMTDAVEFLQKPFSLAQLERKLSSLLPRAG